MDRSEEQFLKELIGRRMEFHYNKISSEKTYQQRKEELEYYDELEKKYQKVLNSLTDEDRTALMEYVEQVSDNATEETENYYTSGFYDGLKLMGALIRYYIR